MIDSLNWLATASWRPGLTRVMVRTVSDIAPNAVMPSISVGSRTSRFSACRRCPDRQDEHARVGRYVHAAREQPAVVSEDANCREAGAHVHDVARCHFCGERHELGSSAERPRAPHHHAEQGDECKGSREDDAELDNDNEESAKNARHWEPTGVLTVEVVDELGMPYSFFHRFSSRRALSASLSFGCCSSAKPTDEPSRTSVDVNSATRYGIGLSLGERSVCLVPSVRVAGYRRSCCTHDAQLFGQSRTPRIKTVARPRRLHWLDSISPLPPALLCRPDFHRVSPAAGPGEPDTQPISTNESPIVRVGMAMVAESRSCLPAPPLKIASCNGIGSHIRMPVSAPHALGGHL